MNNLILKFLPLFSVIFVLNMGFIQAQSIDAPEGISIDQCYAWSMENYPLIKQLELIDKTTDYNLRNALTGNLPQMNLNGQATYQSAVTELPIELPNVEIPSISQDQYKVYADIYQPLTNFRNVKLNQNLIEQGGEIEKQKLEVELYKLKERINQIFFGSLMLQEKLLQFGIITSSLDSASAKIEAAIANGLATPNDKLILDVERISLDQEIEETKANQNAFLIMLSSLTGQSITDAKSLLKPVSMPSSGNINRPELQLFDLQNQAILTQAKQLDNSLMPNIGLFAQAGYGRPALNFLSNDFDFYYIGGLKVNWNISNLYNFKRSKNSLLLGSDRIAIQKETFLLNTNLAETQQSTEISKLQSLLISDQKIIQIREEILAYAEVQLSNGLITSLDFVNYFNEVKKARQSLALHEIQLLLAEATLQVTTGN